jgi:KipI family sensor histidine kinase inhibitor
VPEPRILICGEYAFAIEYGTTVDPDLNALNAAKVPGIVETVPTYRSLLVHVDPLVADPAQLAADALRLARTVAPLKGSSRRWRIPVVYGGAFGIDLDDIAARHGLTPQQLIEKHSAPVYRAYMVGFMPGFTYLGGLDQSIATPRRENPRAKTPAGTISIGGIQAAVASVEAPSGWHLLGRTPVRTFMANRDPVFLLAPGDEVTFEPVPAERWDELDRRAAAGDPVAEIVSR